MALFRRKAKKCSLSKMYDVLAHSKGAWNVNPSTVIDVGAASGKWSLNCNKIWTEADYILVEPLEEQKNILQTLASDHSWNLLQAVAGNHNGHVQFSVSEDLDGSGVYDITNESSTRQVPVITLDSLLPVEGDVLLKLDTHGYEVPIFEGANRLLEQVCLIVVEVYAHQISSNCLLFDELCLFLKERGFRVVSIVDVVTRPGDGALWQADFLFLPESHEIFSHKKYR